MYLKVKSQENIEAANILIDGTLHCYSSSVHCSYFSCFQLIKFVLKDCFNIAYKNQKNNNNTGTHKYIIDLYKQKLTQMGGPANKKNTCIQNMYDLKRMRKIADYDNVCVNEEFADNCINMSILVRQYIIGKHNIR